MPTASVSTGHRGAEVARYGPVTRKAPPREENKPVPGHLHEEAPEASARRQSSCCRQWRQQQRAVPAVPPWCRAAARAGPIATLQQQQRQSLRAPPGWRCGASPCLAGLQTPRAWRSAQPSVDCSVIVVALLHDTSLDESQIVRPSPLQRNAPTGDAMPCRTLIAMT